MNPIVNPQIILKLICEVNPEIKAAEIQEETDLIEGGVLDSYSILSLVQALEDQFDIVFDYSDLRSDHFKNLRSICKILAKNYKLSYTP